MEVKKIAGYLDHSKKEFHYFKLARQNGLKPCRWPVPTATKYVASSFCLVRRPNERLVSKTSNIQTDLRCEYVCIPGKQN